MAIALALCGCTTERQSDPARTATEQLLISTAADRAAKKLALQIPKGSQVFVDATNFDGVDSKYAIAAIRAHLMEEGAKLVDDRGKADTIVEIRTGALSVDQDQLLIGIPAITLPIPLAGQFTTPEIAFFKRDRREGLAKFAAVGYHAADGSMIASSEPDYGQSHKTQWVVLLVGWATSDIGPDDDSDHRAPKP
jgi:uncharacterized protein DUF6655